MSARLETPVSRPTEELPGHGATFGAMLQEFNVAARILNLDPGIWRILTHPKRQIVVSCPVQRTLMTCVASICAMIGPCCRTISTWNGTSAPPRTLIE